MSGGAPRLSVVVCTYDRPERMRACLESLLRQNVDGGEYEVVVVDNGGEEFRFAGPVRSVDVRILREPRPGLSRARNAGLRAARGEIVAYVDDDVEVAPEWAARLLDAFRRLAPEPACVGGRVEPIWEAQPPEWLSDEFARMLSLVDWSETARFLEPSEWAAGCNVAFTRDLLARVGGFDERLGRVGGRLLSMEETLVQAKIREIGHRIYYDPAVVVGHRIPAERLTKRWFLRRAYWNGVSHARLRLQREGPTIRRRARLAAEALKGKVSLASLLGPAADAERLARRCATVGWLGYALAMAGVVR
jgi:glucosyl-dolichyl phosphate glucuronosyltransferase